MRPTRTGPSQFADNRRPPIAQQTGARHFVLGERTRAPKPPCACGSIRTLDTAATSDFPKKQSLGQVEKLCVFFCWHQIPCSTTRNILPLRLIGESGFRIQWRFKISGERSRFYNLVSSSTNKPGYHNQIRINCFT